jgi:hypothetical protein
MAIQCPLTDLRTAATQLIEQIDRLKANPDPDSDKDACEQITDYWSVAGELTTLLIADRIDGNIRSELDQCDAMGTFPFYSGLLSKARASIDVEVEDALKLILEEKRRGGHRPEGGDGHRRG